MLRRRSLIAALLALVLWVPQAFAAATLLPNGSQCFSATTGITGSVGLLGAITGGSGGTAGTYGGVALTGGTGSGATANIAVSGGAVTAVTILNPGTAYVVGDVLSAASGTIGNVTGFSVPISSVAINSALAAGKVYFYQPDTSIFKTTWFNPDQSAAHQNTNPVQLDQNGCAVIYGTGSYRQVVQDSLGNTIWDQLTTDTSANNNTFWAGIAGGTPNVVTVVDSGFNATDGSIINFTANATNTGSATLNPSGFGAIPILKDTTAGPVSLVGGEIIQNNPISVIFRSVDNAFHLLNPPIQSASGSTAPLCGAIAYKVVNNAGSPTTRMDVSAGRAVMISPTGLAINRSNVAFTINLQVNGVNGLDTGSITANTPYYIWMIDNGSATAGLASLSSTSPILPSGYSYSCRTSSTQTSNANTLLTFATFGPETHFAQAFESYINIGSCFAGLVATTSVHIPATATFITGALTIGSGGKAGVGTTANSEIIIDYSAITGVAAPYFRIPTITPSTIFLCSSGGSAGQVNYYGWVDNTNVQ